MVQENGRYFRPFFSKGNFENFLRNLYKNRPKKKFLLNGEIVDAQPINGNTTLLDWLRDNGKTQTKSFGDYFVTKFLSLINTNKY